MICGYVEIRKILFFFKLFSFKSYKKTISLNEEKTDAYINLFELKLINNIDFGFFEDKYKELFQTHKQQFMIFEMIKILKDISLNKNVNIELFLHNYSDVSLNGWSFDEIKQWANTQKKKTKKKLLEAIEMFPNRLINE